MSGHTMVSGHGSRFRRMTPAISLICAAAALLGVVAPQASARHVATHSYASSFPAPFGKNKVSSIAVDEQSGHVFLENQSSGLPLEQFSATGAPAPFTDPEANSSTTILTPGAGGYRAPQVEVDNSGHAGTEGRIFLAAESGVEAFAPSGKRVGGNFPIPIAARDVAVEPGTGNIWVTTVFFSATLYQYTPEGEPTGLSFEVPVGASEIDIDTLGNLYLAGETGGTVYRFDPDTEELTTFAFGSHVAVDPHTNDVYVLRNSIAQKIAQYGVGGSVLVEFGNPQNESFSTSGIAVNGVSGRVYRLNDGQIEIYEAGATIVLPDATTGGADEHHATSTKVHGVANADGDPTTECHFDWGTSTAYENKTDCAEGTILTGSSDTAVSAELTGLTKGTVYHYRLVVSNPTGEISGLDKSFTPSEPATFGDEHVTDVHSDSVVLRGAVNPEGAASTYSFEYGTEDCSLGGCVATPLDGAPLGVAPQDKSIKVTGLASGTTYHYRLVAENQSGPSAGGDFSFTTFPITQLPPDPCPNAHVRQQSSAALLLDCRAYELTSTGNAGGYDVESNLVPGQTPFEGYPRADGPSKVLYGVHEGAIPGDWNPANLGIDPYVATRGDDGWSTRYVGTSASNPFTTGPFASSLLEADSDLRSFAFGGPRTCSPCFADGSTNIPLRRGEGDLVQGMVGSQNPEPADPAGEIGRYFSADGSHLVFGSTTKLEPTANQNGDVTIYSRDLEAESTEVASTLPGGAGTMTGPGIAGLDVSENGSRVIVAKRVSTDAAGNRYWHPYMHRAGTTDSIDLAPGTTSGVLYAGMTADGSSVFFTTKDPLLGSDGDNSADLYQAAVNQAGSLTLKLLSSGANPPVGNVDACDPASNSDGNNWNAVGVASTNDCGVVAIAGGGGIAADDGTAYFLSPEALDGAGTASQPNLFVIRPGEAPSFVATLEPDNPLVRHAVQASAKHVYGDFQVTPDGRYAAFATVLSLTGYDNGGYYEVFRHDSQDDEIVCVSCNPTNARAVGPSTLPSVGLGVTDDGTVFFDSGDAIAPRDLDERLDAYQFEKGTIQLISTGSSPFDSRMLGASADGVDAFFFTHDTLVQQDENGDLVKIYDARADGGFPYTPPPAPCRASDECHGPGTEVPPAPDIRTIRGSGGNEAAPAGKPACKRNQVRRNGRCVKRGHHRKARRHKGRVKHG